MRLFVPICLYFFISFCESVSSPLQHTIWAPIPYLTLQFYFELLTPNLLSCFSHPSSLRPSKHTLQSSFRKNVRFLRRRIHDLLDDLLPRNDSFRSKYWSLCHFGDCQIHRFRSSLLHHHQRFNRFDSVRSARFVLSIWLCDAFLVSYHISRILVVLKRRREDCLIRSSLLPFPSANSNIRAILIQVIFNTGSRGTLAWHFGILLGWVALLMATLPVWTWLERRREQKAASKPVEHTH